MPKKTGCVKILKYARLLVKHMMQLMMQVLCTNTAVLFRFRVISESNHDKVAFLVLGAAGLMYALSLSTVCGRLKLGFLF